jgi:hypothetical protein
MYVADWRRAGSINSALWEVVGLQCGLTAAGSNTLLRSLNAGGSCGLAAGRMITLGRLLHRPKGVRIGAGRDRLHYTFR